MSPKTLSQKFDKDLKYQKKNWGVFLTEKDMIFANNVSVKKHTQNFWEKIAKTNWSAIFRFRVHSNLLN